MSTGEGRPRPGAAARRGRRGLVIVYTGDGKGKTTAALGLAVRAVGRGWRVLMIQFIKGSWHYGELDGAKRLAPEFEITAGGRGFVGILDDRLPFEEHRRAAAETLAFARAQVTGGRYDLVILDEVNNAVHAGLIPLEGLLDLLAARPPELHLVLTGREAHPRVIEAADLVTEMREVKHPFRQGLLAQAGIDY
ncbi:MAG TPA: cob(I)yrinic acid a,c-diamide adenosyltransferase [Thermodesulfobacteriota bacterium]|nr:cob(I)yrinic acid a,c-diamide adenosyltransferase [Thermodesulfobacteriota bacterium]